MSFIISPELFNNGGINETINKGTDKGKDIPYHLSLEVPADKLPKGNIMQQHRKKSWMLIAAVVGGLIYFIKSRKLKENIHENN